MIVKLFIPFVFLSTFIKCKPETKDIPNDKKVMVAVEKEMGLGLLGITFNKPVKFYKNPKDSTAFDQLEFIRDSLPETEGRLLFISESKFAPYRMLSGDSDKMAEENINLGLVRLRPELLFRVLEKTDTFFKIVIDENKFKTTYIKINPNYALYTKLSQVYKNSCSNCPDSNYNPNFYLYETWANYFKRLEFVTVDNLEIYDKPEGTLIFEKNNRDFLPFQVTELKNDWIKVKKPKLYLSHFKDSINFVGWIRWKRNMDILVNITEHTYE